MLKIFRFLSINILLIVPNIILHAQYSETSFPNKIPHNRLVNNKELFNLLDFTNSGLEDVKFALNSGDTLESLRLFAEYLKYRSSPNYFFNPMNVPKRVTEFRKLYPEDEKRIQKDANEFIATYSSDVDWELPGKDLLGRDHTANTIRYLARQAKAVDIALSYYFKEENKQYLNFLKEQVNDFIKDYESGETESGRNDVFERFYAGHRIRNWLFMHHLLLGSSNYQWQDHIFLIRVFLLHGVRLYDFCKKFHWGNHQLHGLAGLYEMTMMYPEFPIMRFWNLEALRVIMEHIESEIKADGFQFERASHYFKLDIMNYFRIYQTSKLNGINLPQLFYHRFHKMFDAIVMLATPLRTLPVLQDAQAVYNYQQVNFDKGKQEISTNDAAELSDPDEKMFMSLGAALFRNSTYKFFGTTAFPADFYWFFNENVPSEYSQMKITIPEDSSAALKESHYYVMRSGRGINELYLIIDGGLAKYKPDHTHGGVLGLIVYAYGEDILPNYRVQYSDPSYRTMKNSLVKNVALADYVLQGQEWISNHARTGFGIWKNLPKPKVHDWIPGEKFDYFSGEHNGFDSIGVHYTRSIIFFKPFCWIIVDRFQGEQLHAYQQIWQGCYTIDDQYNKAISLGQTAKLFILQADPARMEVANRINFGTKSTIFEKRGYKDYSFLTLLYPTSVNSKIIPEIRLFERGDYKQVVVSANEYKHVLYFKKQQEISLDEIDTDAEMVAASYKSNVLYAILLHKGSRLKISSLSVKLESPATVELQLSDNKRWNINFLKGGTQKALINDILLGK